MKLTIDKIEYRIPESWEGVSLKVFCDIISTEQDEMLTPVYSLVKKIALLSGDETLFNVLLSLDVVDELTPLIEHFKWLNEIPDFKSMEPKNEFEIDGETFRLKSNFKKLTTNEFIMIEELNKSTNFDIHYLEVTFGVLFRKIVDDKEVSITLDSVLETISKFRNKVMASDVMGVLSFFLNTEESSSLKISKSSSPRLKMQMESLPLKKKRTKG